MDILSNKLPESVIIEGVENAVNTDFRTFLNFESIMENEELEESEKTENIIKILTDFYVNIPNNLDEALNKLIWFYLGGDSEEETTDTNKAATEKCYSFKHDANYIYSAFLQEYKIDLQTIDMHWWKFKTLFLGLSDETQIKKIMSYRTIDLKEIKEDSQKEFYKKMKEIYKLPSLNTKKENEIINDVLKEVMQYQ